MKTTPLLALGIMLCIPLGTFAQNFSGSDDFSTPDPTHWTVTSTQGGGSFSVNNGVVNFTDSGLDATGTTESSATSAWILNAGSYTADWEVQIDFTLPSGLSMQAAISSLELENSADSTDYFTARMMWSPMSSMPVIQSFVTTNDASTSAVSSSDLSGYAATIRVSYDASTTTLTAAYTEGSVFTDLWSVSIGSDGQAWNMVAGNTFNLSITADHQIMTGTSSAITEGAWTADNFVASGAAVPEPATYALLGGLAILGFCFWRRRRS